MRVKTIRDIILIDFDDIFNRIEMEFLNDISAYDLIDDCRINFSRPDVRKLFLHHIIHNVCNIIDKYRLCSNLVLIIPDKISIRHEIFDYCDYDSLVSLLDNVFDRLNDMLPCIIYKYDVDIFSLDDNDGEVLELYAILNQMINDKYNKVISFEKIKNFTHKCGLNFLNEYFLNRNL